MWLELEVDVLELELEVELEVGVEVELGWTPNRLIAISFNSRSLGPSSVSAVVEVD